MEKQYNYLSPAKPDVFTSRDIPTQESIDTSVFSRDSIKNKNEYRQRIYNFIKEKDGATCDETEVALDIRHQTASCFIRFLTQDNHLRDSGDRRLTRAGRKAIVWIIVED